MQQLREGKEPMSITAPMDPAPVFEERLVAAEPMTAPAREDSPPALEQRLVAVDAQAVEDRVLRADNNAKGAKNKIRKARYG